MKLRYRKPTVDQLDSIASFLGAVAGIAELLVSCKYISNEQGQLVAGLALIAWGFFSNKAPRVEKPRRYQRPEFLLNELTEQEYQ
ncbi:MULTISPECIES: hypothetical protein [unclassified Microcoleus]|uniref:hypothetical protein n=1 Tax=unclassified Microcoleus TaxID=2642155 RepID=UPI002FD75F93